MITLVGTPAWSVAFVLAWYGNLVASATSFSGGATGARYNSARNAVIDTGGGGANFLPGDSAGTTSSGGQYL